MTSIPAKSGATSMNEHIVTTDVAGHNFRFQPEALQKRHSVNYLEDDDVRLHIGIHEIDGSSCLVANDRTGNVWGKAMVLARIGIEEPVQVRVAFADEKIQLQVNDRRQVTFRPDKITPSQMRLRYTLAIDYKPEAAKGAEKPFGELPSQSRSRIAALDPGSAQGFVEFQFFLPEADLWVVGGWIRELRLEQELEGSRPLVAFVSAEAEIIRPATICWHERPDLGGAGIGFLLVMRHNEGSGIRPSQLVGAEFLLSSDRQVSMVAVQGGTEADHVMLQWAKDIIARARGREIALARQMLHQIYEGRDTLSEIRVHLEFDEVVHVPGQGVLLQGWMVDPFEEVVSIRVRSGQVASGNALERWLPITRQDVAEGFSAQYHLPHNRVGFLAFAPIIYDPSDELYLEVQARGESVGFKPLPRPRLSGIPAMRRILGATSFAFDELDHAFGDVIGPPIVALNRLRLAKPMASSEIAFGVSPANPRCSIIVPLYGRLDFLMYQQALFTGLIAAGHEFVYVLDQPERKQEMFALAHSVYERFKQPFRMLLPAENRGFGPASNLGLAAAKGEFICFLNSDIFPQNQDWLDILVDDLEQDPTIGISGPRLLFADGSIQHDGMAFEPVPQFGNWPFPMHPGKGMRPATRPHHLYEATAVTGACMVMRRQVAMELEGFDRDYVIGDFEDADLCLRVKQRGLRCVVDNRAVLYHLERQSQGNQAENWRMNLTLLNAWTFERRWSRSGLLEASPTA